MKRKIVALWGKAGVGKSYTIKKAYDLLLSKFKNAKIDKYPEATFETDISVVVTINGIKIGIESQGDPGGRLPDSLSLFVEVGCKVIICATRTRGQTVDAVNALEKDYDIAWFEQAIKVTKSEQEPSNFTMAKELISEVEEIISTQR